MKYGKKLIFDYITGNQINDYNIDDLENDYEFMKIIIDYTNDKNMYNLCSINVKKNYDFVKFIIDKFSYDIDFICNVADTYLDAKDNELNRMELVFTMCDLIRDKNNPNYKKYELIAKAIKMSKKVIIELYKNAIENDSKLLDVVGEGFWFIFDEYNGNDVILNSFAKEYLNDVFINRDFNLEKMIHADFDTSKDLVLYGYKNYLLNCVMMYDYNLYLYVLSNLELLDVYIEKIDKIIARWQKFISLEEYDKYNKIFNDVHEYILEYDGQMGFNETQILYFIGDEIGILEKLKKYDYLDPDYIDYLLEDIGIDKDSMSFIDLKHYYNIKKIIINNLNTKKEQQQIKTNCKSRSLRLNFDREIKKD